MLARAIGGGFIYFLSLTHTNQRSPRPRRAQRRLLPRPAAEARLQPPSHPRLTGVGTLDSRPRNHHFADPEFRKKSVGELLQVRGTGRVDLGVAFVSLDRHSTLYYKTPAHHLQGRQAWNPNYARHAPRAGEPGASERGATGLDRRLSRADHPSHVYIEPFH